jgi:hypothetical protein
MPSLDEPATWRLPLLRAFGLGRVPLSRTEAALFALGVLALVVAIVQSFFDIRTYSGVDLRHRVVGARWLLRGLDPYTSHWEPGLPDTFYDAGQNYPGPCTITNPPTALLWNLPLAELPHATQRLVWYVLEWAAFLASLMFLARIVPRSRRLLFVLLGLWFFATSSFWRLHVERGQIYVFFLLLLSGGVLSTLARRGQSVWGGLLLGAAVAMRPTLVLIPFVLLLSRRFRLAGTTLIAAGLLVLATLPFGGVQSWRSYFALMNEWGLIATDSDYEPQKYGTPPKYGLTFEGMQSTWLDEGSANTTLPCIYAVFMKRTPGPIDINRVAQYAAASFAMIVLAFAWLRGRRPWSLRRVLALGATAALAVEFFAPVRIGYVDVLYLLPIALLMPELFDSHWRGPLGTVLLLGLAAGLPGVNNVLSSFLSTWLRFVFVMTALLCAAFQVDRRSLRNTAGSRSLSPVACTPGESP